MISIHPAWLGVLLVVLIVVVCVVALTGILYLAVPPARRFLRQDRPLWWVRDIVIAVVIAVLVLVGQSYLASTSPRGGQSTSQDQGAAEWFENLRFVRSTSSVTYQVRPFRQFDLRGANLAGLQLNGANFVQADLSGANLTGTDLSLQPATAAAFGTPAIPAKSTFMQGVNLCRAVLTGANLANAVLVNANLTGVDLTSTRLSGAVLNGADLSQATMPSDTTSKESPLSGMYYDNTTTWPKDFQPPPSGTGDRLQFMTYPVNKALYGDIGRPACH